MHKLNIIWDYLSLFYNKFYDAIYDFYDEYAVCVVMMK